MHITQWGEYGIHFTVFLARCEREGLKTVGASEIASSQEIDLQYAQQILQRLRRGGVIESVRGPLGGYRLSRPADQITMRDILLAAEGDTFEVICDTKPINNSRCAPNAQCMLRPIWHELKDYLNDFFDKYTLDALARMPDSCSPSVRQPSDAPIQIGGGTTSIDTSE